LAGMFRELIEETKALALGGDIWTVKNNVSDIASGGSGMASAEGGII